MNLTELASINPEDNNGHEEPLGSVEPEQSLLALYSCVLNHMQEGVTISDEAGRIVYTNPSENRLFGFKPSGLTGQHITAESGYDAAEHQRRLTEVVETIKRDGTWTGEWLNRRANGELFRSAVDASALELHGRHYLVFVRSELAETKLDGLDSRRLAAIVESSEDAFITKDLNGIITTWNTGAERIFGYTAEEAIGQPISMLAAPNRIDEMPNLLQRLKTGQPIRHYETERRTKDGRIISVSLTVSPLRDGSGEVIGASKIARDVTESKRIRSELAAREFEYANLLSNLPDAITRIGPDLRIRFMSEAVRKMTGLPPEYYVGKTPAEIGIEPRLAEFFRSGLQQILTTGRNCTIEFHFPNPQGEIRHYVVLGVPERVNRKIVGALAITRDVTEQKQAENQQQAVERELMLLIEASGALLASPQSCDVLQTILGLAMRFVSADAYGVWRKQHNGWALMSSSGLSDQYLVFAGKAAGIESPIQETVMIEDVAASGMLEDRRAAHASEGIRSMLIVPMFIRGTNSGTVVFYWRQRRIASGSDIRIASALGNLASAALGTSDLYEKEQESRARAERSEDRSKFLAQAGAVLSSSLDFTATLNNVAKLAVPSFADWCSVDVVNERGEAERITVYHSDPEMLDLAADYRTKYPPQEDDAARVVLQTGKSILVPTISDDQLVAAARSAEHLEMLRKLQLHSLIFAPIVSGTEILGVITFVSSESSHAYDEADLETAEELARRAGTAIAHARLYAHVQENEERLRLAITAAKLGVWENDQRNGVLTSSAQSKHHVGCPESEELTYQALADRIHPDDLERWRDTIDTAIQRRSPFEVEYRVRVPGCPDKWVMSYGQPIFSAGGSLLRTVGVTMDVTENRTLLLREKEARRTAELLNSIGPVLLSELDPWKLARSIIDIAVELVEAEYGVFLYRADEKTLLYSFCGIDRNVFDQMDQQQRDELIGRWQSYTELVCESDSAGGASAFQGLAGPIRSFLVAPVRSRGGDIMGALLFGHPEPHMFHPPDSAIVTGIAAHASIALENARLFGRARVTEHALRRSNEDLRRANEDLNQFAYSASHDLQEPLRMVAIYSQMLARRYHEVLDDKGREYLRFTIQGAKRMEMLVRDLLTYTQAASAARGEVGAIDTHAVFEQALQNLESSIHESQAAIRATALPSVRVEEVHLIQLLQNLIGNAIKYRKLDEPPQIVLEAQNARNGMVEFRVRDNGIGIPAQYQKQVFGLFKRLHSGDQYAGTGIGLAICQRIVERYGGRIWVESEEGRGSVFIFTLPGADTPAPA